MMVKIIENPKAWWDEFGVRIKKHPLLKDQYSRVSSKIDQGAMVFRFGDANKTTDSVMVLSPGHRGVVIELVYSTEPLSLARYFDVFMALVKHVNYQYIYVMPVSESRRRLFKRFGFVGDDKKKMMVLEV